MHAPSAFLVHCLYFPVQLLSQWTLLQLQAQRIGCHRLQELGQRPEQAQALGRRRLEQALDRHLRQEQGQQLLQGGRDQVHHCLLEVGLQLAELECSAGAH